MPFPAGVTTRPLTFGPAFAMANGAGLEMEVVIKPSRSLVWRPTGSPAVAIRETFGADAGLEHTVSPPVTDQTGWGDGSGNLIDVSGEKQSHLYEVTINYLRDGVAVMSSTSKWIALPEGDGSPIDLDNMIPVSGAGGATVYIPDTWEPRIAELESLVTTTDEFMALKANDQESAFGGALAAKIATVVGGTP